MRSRCFVNECGILNQLGVQIVNVACALSSKLEELAYVFIGQARIGLWI